MIFTDLEIKHCTFEKCSLSITNSLRKMTTFQRAHVYDNTVRGSCVVGPVVLEDVVMDGLKIHDRLVLSSPLLKHVTLKGEIGELRFGITAGVDRYDQEVEALFSARRQGFYSNADWALDISEGIFSDLELEGIPATLLLQLRFLS